VARVAGFPCIYSISTNFQGNFLLYLNLNSVLWIVQPFSYEEIDLGFLHVAATTQKTAGHGTRGVTRKGKGDAIPWRQVTMGAPNQCTERPMATAAPLSLSNVTSISFNIEHMLPKDLSFEYGGAKLASCSGHHPTSLRPCTTHITIN